MYGVSTKVGAGFGETVHRVISALKKEGFGMQSGTKTSTLTRSQGHDTHPRSRVGPIQGTCNLEFCYQAISAERGTSLLPSCNVVVREGDDGNTRVLIMNPPPALELTPNRQAPRQASMLREKLGRVIDSLRD